MDNDDALSESLADIYIRELPRMLVKESRGLLMDERRIRSGLERDEESGNYTFFDYIQRAMRLPSEMLVQHTNIESMDTRREVMRYMEFPNFVPARRIWKKVTFE